MLAGIFLPSLLLSQPVAECLSDSFPEDNCLDQYLKMIAHYGTFPSIIIKAIENTSLQLQNINNMKISYLYLTHKMLSLTDGQQKDICKMGN